MKVIYILWLREVKKYLRSRTQIIASLGSPIMYLGVLGFGLGPVFERAGEGSYLQFMAPWRYRYDGAVHVDVFRHRVALGSPVWVFERDSCCSGPQAVHHDGPNNRCGLRWRSFRDA